MLGALAPKGQVSSPLRRAHEVLLSRVISIGEKNTIYKAFATRASRYSHASTRTKEARSGATDPVSKNPTSHPRHQHYPSSSEPGRTSPTWGSQRHATTQSHSVSDLSSQAAIDRKLDSLNTTKVLSFQYNTAGEMVDARKKPLVLVEDDQPVSFAVAQMKSRHVGSILVVSKDNPKDVLGLITERDLLFAFADVGPGVWEDSVGSIMRPTSKLVTAEGSSTTGECFSTMLRLHIRHLPVLEEDGVRGVLSLRDLVSTFEHDNISILASSAKANQYQVLRVIDQEPLPPVAVASAIATRPQDLKKATGGEDASFVYHDEVGGVTTLAVADGVGSWFEHGVDPALFSRRLIERCRYEVECNQQYMPRVILDRAWEKMVTDDEEIHGSSTICILSIFNEDRSLEVCNLGDSGFLLLRRDPLDRSKTDDGVDIFVSSQQQAHDFNHPYQLGSFTNTVFDTPVDSATMTLPLQEGDVIVLATDGLFDNLFQHEIVELVNPWLKSGDNPDPSTLARTLLTAAYDRSIDRTRDGPFAVTAKDNGTLWGGGMPDDISVVVAHITAAGVTSASTLVA